MPATWDAETKLAAMKELYLAQQKTPKPLATSTNGSADGATAALRPSTRIATKYGLQPRHLEDCVKKLPAGLDGMRLHRAVLRVCFPAGSRGRRQNYTPDEFKACVIGSLASGGKSTDFREIMIARGKFMAARAGLKKWRANGAGDDDGYFRTLDNRPGPKTKLLPDEERVWAETNAVDAETQYGKDARQSCRSLNDMCEHLGVAGGGSRKHLQGIVKRAKISEKAGSHLHAEKASDMSINRSKALTPEKKNKMFNFYEEGIAALADAGRFGDARVPAGWQIVNTDEMSPGDGKYGKYICGATTLRKWRQKTGEHVPFHTTGVVSVRGDGVFLRDASGVVHKCGSAGHAGFADGLNPYGLCHTTPSGHMDGPGMLKVATLLAAAMGKENWDHSKPWNQQPARCNATFREEPVIWLLDGHYSHQEYPFLQFCKEHDIHVFFSAAGASEYDQACDCGIMAALQQWWGDTHADWRNSHRGMTFEPEDWNAIWTEATAKLLAYGGKAIVSAFKKTGWFPLNRNASNYQALGDYEISAAVDNKGAERMQATVAAADVQELRPLEGEQCVLYRQRAAHDGTGLLLRKKAMEWFLQSTQIPAEENRKEQERRKANRCKKRATPDPTATDAEGLAAAAATTMEPSATSSGQWAQAKGYANNCEQGFKVKVAKASEEQSKKAKAMETQRLRLAKACAAAAVAERKLRRGAELKDLNVTELKDLIIGRGGKCKSGARKVELIVAAEALSPQSVAMDDEEDEVDAIEDSLTLMDDQRQQPQSQPQQQQQQQQQPQQQRQQQQQQPQKAKSAPRKRPAKRQRKRPAPQQQQQPDGNASCTLDEEALLASWRELVSTSAKSIGRSANNIARYLTEAKFQVEVLSVVGVAEIMQLVGAVGGIDSAGRARVHTLLVAGLANPLLKTPTKLKIQHTLSRAALSSVLQAVAIK